MKTIKDVIDYILGENEIAECGKTTCKDCEKFNWCYVDTYILTLEYLYNGEY